MIERSVGLSGSLTRRLKFPKNLRPRTVALSSESSTFTDLRFSITIGIVQSCCRQLDCQLHFMKMKDSSILYIELALPI